MGIFRDAQGQPTPQSEVEPSRHYAKIRKNHTKFVKVDTTVCSAVGIRLKINSFPPFERAQYLIENGGKLISLTDFNLNIYKVSSGKHVRVKYAPSYPTFI